MILSNIIFFSPVNSFLKEKGKKCVYELFTVLSSMQELEKKFYFDLIAHLESKEIFSSFVSGLTSAVHITAFPVLNRERERERERERLTDRANIDSLVDCWSVKMDRTMVTLAMWSWRDDPGQSVKLLTHSLFKSFLCISLFEIKISIELRRLRYNKEEAIFFFSFI